VRETVEDDHAIMRAAYGHDRGAVEVTSITPRGDT
jgi:hypothetical protein